MRDATETLNKMQDLYDHWKRDTNRDADRIARYTVNGIKGTGSSGDSSV